MACGFVQVSFWSKRMISGFCFIFPSDRQILGRKQDTCAHMHPFPPPAAILVELHFCMYFSQAIRPPWKLLVVWRPLHVHSGCLWHRLTGRKSPKFFQVGTESPTWKCQHAALCAPWFSAHEGACEMSSPTRVLDIWETWQAGKLCYQQAQMLQSCEKS